MFSRALLISALCVSQILAVPLEVRPIGDGIDSNKAKIVEAVPIVNQKIHNMKAVLDGPNPENHPAFKKAFGDHANLAAIKNTVNTMETGRIKVADTHPDSRTTQGLTDPDNGNKVTFGSNFYANDATPNSRAGTIIHEAAHALSGAVDHYDEHGTPLAKPSDGKNADGSWKSTTQFGYADSHLNHLKDTASQNMHLNADSYRVFGDECPMARELFRRAFEEEDLEVRADLIRRGAAFCPIRPRPKKVDAATKPEAKKSGATAEKSAHSSGSSAKELAAHAKKPSTVGAKAAHSPAHKVTGSSAKVATKSKTPGVSHIKSPLAKAGARGRSQKHTTTSRLSKPGHVKGKAVNSRKTSPRTASHVRASAKSKSHGGAPRKGAVRSHSSASKKAVHASKVNAHRGALKKSVGSSKAKTLAKSHRVGGSRSKTTHTKTAHGVQNRKAGAAARGKAAHKGVTPKKTSPRTSSHSRTAAGKSKAHVAAARKGAVKANSIAKKTSRPSKVAHTTSKKASHVGRPAPSKARAHSPSRQSKGKASLKPHSAAAKKTTSRVGRPKSAAKASSRAHAATHAKSPAAAKRPTAHIKAASSKAKPSVSRKTPSKKPVAAAKHVASAKAVPHRATPSKSAPKTALKSVGKAVLKAATKKVGKK